MRIWRIPTPYLDDQRLVAALHEICACYTCVRLGRQWGNTTRDFKHSMQVARLHFDDIRAELQVRRGPKWTTSATFDLDLLPPDSIGGPNPSTDEHRRQDVIDLRRKWRRENYYFGVGRLDLRWLEARYNLPQGESVEQAAQHQANIRKVFKENRLWFNSYRELHPKSTLGERIDAYRVSTGLPPVV